MFRRNAGISPERECADFNQNLQTVTAPSADSPGATIAGAGILFFLLMFVLFLVLPILAERWRRRRKYLAKRRRFIETYLFPPEVLGALRQTWPEFLDWHIAMAQQALRSFFIAHLDAGPDRVLAMPSKAADALWHAFILDTRAYHAFCEDAFGRYFHHLPDYRMADGPVSRSAPAMDTLWRSTCGQAGIDPRHASRLPILFDVDRLLRLPDARRHDPVALSRGYCQRRGHFDFVLEIDLSGCAGDASDGGDGGDSGCGGGCGGD